ncbi:LysM peptidoglycan-binding domain-containing protein, partial [Gammaproteobacteria bacterium]|nr:LysM peptidoglycan-binding domain-containing protein [Gammaproteobacteria bacterium]
MENLPQYLSVKQLMIPRLFLLISIFSLPIFADNSNASFKVQSGDTLWSISRQLDIPVKELIELNSFRVFSSGAPNIQIGQLIKTQRTSDDDVRDYCYSELTFDGVNFSKTLKKSDVIISCVQTLMSSLDHHVIGDLNSWYMTEEEAKDAGGEKGILLSWDGSKDIRIDDTFWEIYFSDIRYSYYFFNLGFSNTQRDNADKVMIQAAFKGDAIAADHVLAYNTYFFKKFPGNFKDFKDFSMAIINNLDPLISEYYKVIKHPSWYLDEFKKQIDDPIKYKNLPHRYQGFYLLDEISSAFKSGDLKFYQYRNEVINFIQNSNSKLLTWAELALVVNHMYFSLNLGDPKLGLEISSILERRLELIDDSSANEFSIYNRFIQNLEFDSEYSIGFNIVLTWILNITASLDDLYPMTYELFIERRNYLLEFVNKAYSDGYISDDNLAAWNSDTASKILKKNVSCQLAETYFIPAFDYYEFEYNQRKQTIDDLLGDKASPIKLSEIDSIDEPLA